MENKTPSQPLSGAAQPAPQPETLWSFWYSKKHSDYYSRIFMNRSSVLIDGKRVEYTECCGLDALPVSSTRRGGKFDDYEFIGNANPNTIITNDPAPAAPVAVPAGLLSDEQIEYMVRRFLAWRLPEHFRPDAGISFKPTFNDHLPVAMKHNPIGTNLFDYTQTKEMVRHMLEGMPAPPAPLPPPQEPTNSCNRHPDCNAAEEKVMQIYGITRDRISPTFHCFAEDCEDCFGT